MDVFRDSTGAVDVSATDARELFDSGNQLLAVGRHSAALALYDELIANFSSSQLAVAAMYNAGLALEKLGRPDDALAKYFALAARANAGRDGRDAALRAGAVMTELGRYTEASAWFEALSRRDSLSAQERVELAARHGFILVEQKSYADAEVALHGAIRRSAAGGEIGSDYFIAMAHFYLGEIPRRQLGERRLRLPEKQMALDLEEMAGLASLANERYDNAIGVGNIYWSTAAGYELGGIQEAFRDALVMAPNPEQFHGVATYRRFIHRQGRVHLHKALSVYGRTLEYAELHDAATPWSEAARRRITEITTLIAREARGELVPTRVARPTWEPRGSRLDGAYRPPRAEL